MNSLQNGQVDECRSCHNRIIYDANSGLWNHVGIQSGMLLSHPGIPKGDYEPDTKLLPDEPIGSD